MVLQVAVERGIIVLKVLFAVVGRFGNCKCGLNALWYWREMIVIDASCTLLQWSNALSDRWTYDVQELLSI